MRVNPRHRNWRMVWPVLVFSLILLATAALAVSGYTWTRWRPASCMPGACFCEAIRSGPVAQPANAYSNLAFVLAGLFMLAASAHPAAAGKRGRFGHTPAYGLTYGGAVVVIGLGSLFYHASLSFAGQWFDVMGMCLLGSFMALYNVARLRPMPGVLFVTTFVAVNVVLGIVLLLAPEMRRALFAALVLIALVLEMMIWRLRRPDMYYRYFVSAFAVFALAYAIWILDDMRVLCAPESWLQGHSVWHMLSALAASGIYLFYRSERAKLRT